MGLVCYAARGNSMLSSLKARGGKMIENIKWMPETQSMKGSFATSRLCACLTSASLSFPQ